MAFNKIDRSLANPENLPGMPPALLLQYQFQYNFATIAEAFLKKYNWEPRTNFTTISSFEQIDDDRVQFQRRHQSFNIIGTAIEQVIINRATQEIESRMVTPNHDGTYSTLSKTTFRASSDEGKTDVDNEVFDTQGNGSAKVELFKHQCTLIHKAMQFSKWATEQ